VRTLRFATLALTLAAEALAGAAGCGTEWIGIASQDSGFDWRDA